MNVPYIGPIEGLLTCGYSIRVCGSVLHNAMRFAINLQCGPNIYPRDDVALHFFPDFMRHCVIRNNILQNSWGPEEFEGLFPFAKGSPFEITFYCQEDCFKIAVNGQHFTSFFHRIQYSKVSHIAIDGDITLGGISYFGSQPQYGFQTSSALPYPTGGSCGYQSQPGYPTPYPTNQPPAFNGPSSYAPIPRVPSPNPYYSQQAVSGYVQQPHNLYPTQPGQPHTVPPPGSPAHQKSSLINKAGMALTGGLGAGLLGAAIHGKKGLKNHKKAQKRALKYGLPIAGVGLGAYALKKGFHGGSSSSSSSSSD